jgi:hypothetical protein
MSANTGPIPPEWRKTVAAILREGKEGTVLIRRRAAQDWRDIFPDAFDYELLDTLALTMDEADLMGKRHEMSEPGETYAFFFNYKQRRLYGKINLTNPDPTVIVYSAHRPLKGEEWP